MKIKRIIAAVLLAVMLVLALPAVFAAESIVFSFSSSVSGGSKVYVGDVITYTVSLDASSGFAFGTLYFAPSDNLSYVGATYRGGDVAALRAITGENAGAYGILIDKGTLITGADAGFCTIKFKVVSKGTASVRFYAYQLHDGNSNVGASVNNSTLTYTASERPKTLEPHDNSGYTIDGALLRGVKEKTTLEEIITKFKSGADIRVYNASGSEVTSPSALIGTGYTVSAVYYGEKVHTVTAIVLGDVSGNGQVDPIDYQRVRRYIFGNYSIEGPYLEAARVSGRADVTPVDYQRIRRHIFGTFNIYQ